MLSGASRPPYCVHIPFFCRQVRRSNLLSSCEVLTVKIALRQIDPAVTVVELG